MQTRPAKDALTQRLIDWHRGDQSALPEIVSVVYQELRHIARARLRGECANHTLQTAALVSEAYSRLVQLDRIEFHGRTHFFAMASRIMRQVLVDRARRRLASKRGGDAASLTIADLPDPRGAASIEILALDRALEELANFDPRQERIVELRFFAGLTFEETAEALGVSRATVERDWAMAKTWLYKRLAG
jgi:RNA polymerase sigma-70 factor, ECF subfamily